MSMRMILVLALTLIGCDKTPPEEEIKRYDTPITCERPLKVWVARYGSSYYCEGLLENGAYNCMDTFWHYRTVGAAELHTYLVVKFGDSLTETRLVAEDCK